VLMVSGPVAAEYITATTCEGDCASHGCQEARREPGRGNGSNIPFKVTPQGPNFLPQTLPPKVSTAFLQCHQPEAKCSPFEPFGDM
jgi:hypothetical protein